MPDDKQVKPAETPKPTPPPVRPVKPGTEERGMDPDHVEHT